MVGVHGPSRQYCNVNVACSHVKTQEFKNENKRNHHVGDHIEGMMPLK